VREVTLKAELCSNPSLNPSPTPSVCPIFLLNNRISEEWGRWMDGEVCGHMGGWMDGWMDGQVDKWVVG
jgi:hypothetical protein